jgi:hypothetical protein
LDSTILISEWGTRRKRLIEGQWGMVHV